MAQCKERNKLDFPCSEGFTGTLEKSVKSLDNNQVGLRFKKTKRR